MDGDAPRVELGRLDGAWGTDGWVRVYSLTEQRENIFDYQPWLTDGEPGLLHVRDWRRQGPRLMAKLEEVDDRDQAERLRGLKLYVRRAVLPEPASDSYYWSDLIGLEVFDTAGSRLGRVSGLLDAGAHDVLELKPAGPAAPPVLIPFVIPRFVRRVDLAGGRIEVDWDPDWLADEPDAK